MRFHVEVYRLYSPDTRTSKERQLWELLFLIQKELLTATTSGHDLDPTQATRHLISYIAHTTAGGSSHRGMSPVNSLAVQSTWSPCYVFLVYRPYPSLRMRHFVSLCSHHSLRFLPFASFKRASIIVLFLSLCILYIYRRALLSKWTLTPATIAGICPDTPAYARSNQGLNK